MDSGFNPVPALRVVGALCFCALFGCSILYAQGTPQKPAEQSTEKVTPPVQPENPAQIELLETHIRFEANGDSRKEVHAQVKVNNELGARQFARINFNYNRSFEAIEIPLVHITHASGGSADILPSAITDLPNPAVMNAPAYQDVRVKSVRILGLEPGDLLEYRVITTVTHHPLAPDFWLDHSFDRTGIVTKEVFELDLPTSSEVHLKINPETPATSLFGDVGGVVFATRKGYRWERSGSDEKAEAKESNPTEPDIVLTTYASWEQLTRSNLVLFFGTAMVTPPEVEAKATEQIKGLTTPEAKCEAIYNFVSQKIRTIELPLGATGFRTRAPNEILSSGYATPEDKFALFAALAQKEVGLATAALVSSRGHEETGNLARPTLFDHVLAQEETSRSNFWLDLSLEVAPFGLVPSQFRGKQALLVVGIRDSWRKIPEDPPFPAKQSVKIDASLASDGMLRSKVHYALRGDNELLLRIAFHQTPKEKWRDVAQLLALSDGFRGKITNVEASDPYATKEPFTVDYEISQPKFVDWSKKPVRIPAFLPQIGLPDVPGKPASDAAIPSIELGTPLEVETHVVVHLPAGTTARAPIGVSVSRDYATFASQYEASAETITATRHVDFLLRELPADRAADYNSFRRAVQNDEAQDFTLERPDTEPAKTKSAAPDHPAPPRPNPTKP